MNLTKGDEKMSNESQVRKFLWDIRQIEKAVERGQDGLVEVRWMYEKGATGEQIVRALNESARKVVLAAFIDNFCE